MALEKKGPAEAGPKPGQESGVGSAQRRRQALSQTYPLPAAEGEGSAGPDLDAVAAHGPGAEQAGEPGAVRPAVRGQP